MYLQYERIAMQQQKLSTGEVDDVADNRTRQVAGIDLQYGRHNERESTTQNTGKVQTKVIAQLSIWQTSPAFYLSH